MTIAARVRLEVFGTGGRTALEAVVAALAALRGSQLPAGPAPQAWIVGGAVRDALAGAGPRDLDLAVPSGAIALARKLGDALGAAFLVLDEARGAARILGAAGYAWQGPQIDITDFRAPDLAGDLRGRDFTVNALAVPLRELAESGEAAVEDPMGGLGDLRLHTVRLCAPQSLEEDPVRVLRAARLAIMPGWTLDGAIGPAAQRAASGLSRVSAERTRDELLAILAESGAAAGLRLLDQWGALAVLLPEREAMKATAQPEPHLFDVWEHSLRAVEGADRLAAQAGELAPWGHVFESHLDEPLGDGATRREALKLAALLHDVAKPETRTIEAGRVRFLGHDLLGAERVRVVSGRLRLSGRLAAVLERLVRHHLRPMHLAMVGEVTRRARFRLFRDLGDDALDLLLLALADTSGLRGDSPFSVWSGPDGRIVRELMAGYVEEAAALSSPPLLDGREAMEALGLAPGPELGRLLGLLREAQAMGAVVTREGAIAYLRKLRGGPLDTSRDRPIE